VIIEQKSESLAKGLMSEAFADEVPEGPLVYSPRWERLDQLSLSEKENALIQLETSVDLSAALLRQVRDIEQLWNQGDFTQAIDRLRHLEQSQVTVAVALGISWRVPLLTSDYKWGNDVQIGVRDSIEDMRLDFHEGSGNLFVVYKPRNLASGSDGWAVCVSTDGGQSWSETYEWSSSFLFVDIDGVVLGDHFFVSYTHDVGAIISSSARMRRFHVGDGSSDGTYGWQEIFSKNDVIIDIAVAASEDHSVDQIYHLAILEDSRLIYHYSVGADPGITWSEIVTGITGAHDGLDACYNLNPTAYFLFASYRDANDSLHVARRSSTLGWEDIQFTDESYTATSIGAYEDRIITVYQTFVESSVLLKYRISYDGGDTWVFGYVDPALSGSGRPVVTARKGGGIMVVYPGYMGGAWSIWYRHRDYDIVNWSSPETLNDNDRMPGLPIAVEWIPPFIGHCHAYGAVYVEDWASGSGAAYFDRHAYLTPGDANDDGVVNVADVVHVVNFLYRGGDPPTPVGAGDANCDGIVNVADVVHLVNYLYRGGDPPCCP
jgi:hypothetical protein